jgi:WD40 repeat protein
MARRQLISATKAKAMLALVLALGVAAAGLGLADPKWAKSNVNAVPSEASSPLQAQSTNSARSVPNKMSRNDFYGDPLPPGALARMGSIQLRHRQASVTFSHDNKTLISAGADRIVRTWDVSTGKELRHQRLEQRDPPSDRFQPIILSPNGQVLAAWEGPAVYVYDTATGKEVHSLPLDAAEWVGLRFSPDGSLLALEERVTPEKNVFQLWQMSPLAKRWSVENEHSFGPLAFSSDGKFLILSIGDATLQLRDAKTGREICRGQGGSTWGISLSPDSKTLAFGDLSQGTVRFFDPVKLTERETLKLPGIEQVTSLGYSPDGKLLAVGGKQELVLWNLDKRKEVSRLPYPQGNGMVPRFVFAPDGKTLAFEGEVAILIWDVKTGQPRLLRPGHVGGVSSVAVSPNGKILASSALGDRKVGLWDTATGKPHHFLQDNNEAFQWIQCCGFGPDGKYVMTGGASNGMVWMGEAITGKEISRFVFEEMKGGNNVLPVLNFQISADGKRLASFALESALDFHFLLNVWDVAKGDLLVQRRYAPEFRSWPTSNGGRQTVLDFFPCFTRDGKALVMRSGKGLSIEETLTGRQLARISGSLGTPVTFSHDGRLLAATHHHYPEGSSESKVEGLILAETATGKEVLRISLAQVNPIGFSPDDRVLATADAQAFNLWDTATGKLLFRRPWALELLSRKGWNPAQSLVFMPNGHALATGMEDGTILVWDLERESWAKSPLDHDLDQKKLDSLWADLLADDAAQGYRAIHRLTEAPEQTVPFLRERLQAKTNSDVKLADRLIADLDSSEFTVRETADKKWASRRSRRCVRR